MKRFLTFLDGIGSVGALFAAIAAPCCFPLFAGVIAAVGLGALGKFEGFALYALQGFALLSLFGLALGSATPQPLAVRTRCRERRRSRMVFLRQVLPERALWRFVRLARRDRLESFVGALPQLRHA